MNHLPQSNSAQAGFTLIELMIVVAILGILSAVALPSYEAYTVRGRVSELLIVGASYKAAVAENIVNNGGTIDPAADNCKGVVGLPTDTRNTLSFSCVPATGVITVVGKPEARNVVITFTPSTGGQVTIRWDCRTAPEFYKFVPAECRAS
jgi:type IV pilus assembly protein PilA